METRHNPGDGNKAHGLWRTVMSVLAAFFGVQSDRNRERDFTHGNPVTFIVVGLLMTILLVLGLYGLVQVVMAYAGA